jgi:hypothetical protein
VKAAAIICKALLGGLVLVSLESCRPLYLSPVPRLTTVTKRLVIDSSSRIIVRQGRPALEIVVKSVPNPGWLALQWFGPDNRLVASVSIWVNEDDGGVTRILLLPSGVPVIVGEWRVLAVFGDRVVRQFSGSVP